jgi:membrane protein implicated in regulation of membrane protease activity
VRLRRFLFENGLTLFFLLLFLVALVGQAIAGYHEFNSLQVQHASSTISFGRYITSSDYGSAVMENWQSEYLQFTLFILLTVFLVQRGSPESKKLDKAGTESDQEQQVGGHARPASPPLARHRGLRMRIYSNSLVLVMGTIWIGSWAAQSITGWTEFNADRFQHVQDAISYGAYLGSAHFWQTTLQNWQSEFLAVASMAILAVYLRQRGSPESKPVGAPHDATGTEG